jgi:hypothetical protein
MAKKDPIDDLAELFSANIINHLIADLLGPNLDRQLKKMIRECRMTDENVKTMMEEFNDFLRKWLDPSYGNDPSAMSPEIRKELEEETKDHPENVDKIIRQWNLLSKLFTINFALGTSASFIIFGGYPAPLQLAIIRLLVDASDSGIIAGKQRANKEENRGPAGTAGAA